MKKINQFIRKYSKYLLLLIPILVIGKYLDNDIWFMLNHGRYISQNGFTTIEPFTVHEGLEFSFEKWLTCLIFYKVYEKLGIKAIISLVYIVGIIIELLVLLATSIISKNKTVNLLTTTITCSLLFIPYLKSRPQIFSFALLILQFIFTEKYAKTNNKKYLFPLPAVSIVYMQLHSTMWPMLFIMLLPYLCDSPKLAKGLGLPEIKYNKLPLIIIALISLAVGIINPYGIRSVTYLIKSIGIANTSISEVAAPDILDILNLTSVLAFIHAMYWAIKAIKKDNKLNVLLLRYIYILLGTFALFAYALRNGAFYIIFAGIITAYMFENMEFKNYDAKMAVIAYIGLIVAVIVYTSDNSSIYRQTESYEALNGLKEQINNAEDIKIYTDFNSGGYAEFLGFKAYIDPRAEVFIKEINGKENIFKEFTYVNGGKIHYDEIQKKYKFDYWLVATDSTLNTYIAKDDNYKLVVETTDYNIYQVQ